MAGKGPLPKPSALRAICGGRGRRVSKTEPKPKTGSTAMPQWLSSLAKAQWAAVVSELDRLGLITQVDGMTLAAYCQACAELIMATKTLDAEGRYVVMPVKNKQGEVIGEIKKTHPAVSVQNDSFARVNQFLSHFGLSPAARVRLKAENHDDHKETDELTAIQNQLRAV